MECASCEKMECYEGKDCTEIAERVVNLYLGDTANMEIAKGASFTEGKFYARLTRLEEAIAFSKEMRYTKLGIAFCIGLAGEAEALDKILRGQGFTVSSVCCKVCGITKDRLGLPGIDESRQEGMCNPVGQAQILNGEKMDLNIIVGLCIGHDILFSKHSSAPVTTLVVKDRVLAHNPAGALYSGYYRRKWRLR